MDADKVEEIISGAAVIVEKLNFPPEVVLFHTNGDTDPVGQTTQPKGWKLPGGRYEKPRDETPRHTAQNETLLETGFEVELEKDFPESEFGEAVFEEKKKRTNMGGTVLHLKVYTFLMKKVGSAVVQRLETDEGGAVGSFSLKDVLLMPLARNTETGEENPYGIQYSARERIILALERAGYDFLELIPDLPKLFDELDPEELGERVYWILRDARGEETAPAVNPEPVPAIAAHEKGCGCDDCWRRFSQK